MGFLLYQRHYKYNKAFLTLDFIELKFILFHLLDRIFFDNTSYLIRLVIVKYKTYFKDYSILKV